MRPRSRHLPQMRPQQEQAKLLQLFYPSVKEAIKTLPGTSNLKQLLKVRLAGVADAHTHTLRLQKIMEVCSSIDALSAVGPDHDNSKAAWAALATAVNGANGCKAESEEAHGKVATFVTSFVNAIMKWTDVDMSYTIDQVNIVQSAISLLVAKDAGQVCELFLAKAKAALGWAAYAIEVRTCVDAFKAWGDEVSSESTSRTPHPAFAALARVLQREPPSVDASLAPTLKEIADKQVALAAGARKKVEATILDNVAKQLAEAANKFEPMAGGAKNGQSWKQGLKKDAPLPDVIEHYTKTLKKRDGQEIYATWQALGNVLKTFDESIKTYNGDSMAEANTPNAHLVDDRLRTRADMLLRKGRVTVSEGILLEDGGLHKKNVVTKQIRELAKAGASDTDLQSAVYRAIQSTLKGTT